MNRKNTFSVIADSLKTAYKIDKTAVIMTVLAAVIDAVSPYVAILLSAYIVDGLTSGAEFGHLVLMAVMGLGIIFILQIMEKIINKVNQVHTEVCVRKFNMEMSKKTLTMDFEQLESPMINDIRNRIRNDHGWGAGFYSVFWQLSWLLGSIFSLIAAAIVLAPLVTTGSFFASWTTPMYLLLLFAITISAALFNAKYVNKKTFALMDEASTSRSYAGHFIYGGIDYKVGKDIRIYDASPIIKEYIDDVNDWRQSWIRRFFESKRCRRICRRSCIGYPSGWCIFVCGSACRFRCLDCRLGIKICNDNFQLCKQPVKLHECVQ